MGAGAGIEPTTNGLWDRSAHQGEFPAVAVPGIEPGRSALWEPTGDHPLQRYSMPSVPTL